MADWSPCSAIKAVDLCSERAVVGPSHRKVLGVGHLEGRINLYLTTSADG